MEERTIELTIISATDLKKVTKFGKQTCYAVAYIHPKQKKRTKTDQDGGTNPSWNEILQLTCDEQRMLAGGVAITVDVYSDGTFGDKVIGTITIPLSDIAQESKANEGKDGDEKQGKGKDLKYLAFEVRRDSGKSKGVLNVAIRLGEKRTIQMYQQQPPSQAYGQSSGQGAAYASAAYPAPALGYPNQNPLQPYGAPPPQYANQYPPQPYGAPSPYGNQYPPYQQGPYYPQQPGPYYAQQPPPYYQQQPQRGRKGGGGGSGMALGAGLLGGALGGLLIADAIDDFDDGGDFDGGE